MIIEITNTPRDYAWGSTTAIAELRGVEPSGEPEAELWLGTHPSSPARLVGRAGTLLEVAAAPLPFLLKVLAAESPLSLQAHPDHAQAAAGFSREEAAGVPLDAPGRNYQDRSGKPEMVYALGQFRALVGFRPVAESLTALGALESDPRIAALRARLVDDASLPTVVGWLIGGDPLVADVIDALSEARFPPDPSWDAVRTLADHYPGDPGIAVAVLMNPVVLEPGEVVYVPPGTLHSYLSGTAIELMAPSDNVLRGGLTAKHVDVAELLAIADFATGPVQRVTPATRPGISTFRSPHEGLGLILVRPSEVVGGIRISVPIPAIALALTGDVALSSGDDLVQLARGAAVYLPDPDLALSGSGSVVIASGDLDRQLRPPACGRS